MDATAYELVPDIFFFIFKLPYQVKLFKLFLRVAVVVNAIFVISDLILFCIQGLSPTEYLEHGITPFFQIYASFSIITILDMETKMTSTVKALKRTQWPMEGISRKTKRKILGQAFEERCAFYVVLTIMFIYMCSTTEEIFKILLISYIEEHISRYGRVAILAVFVLNGIALSSCLLLLPFMGMYCAVEWIVQLELLIDFAKTIAVSNQVQLLHYHSYQRQTTVKFMKLIKKQIQLLEQYLALQTLFSSEGMKLIVGSVGFTVVIVFSAIKGSLDYHILAIHFAIFSFYFTYVTTIGQRYENKWRLFHRLVRDFPWYNFDGRNRRLYLTLLASTSKDVRFVVWNSLALNYELYLKVWKTLYTIANTLYKLRGQYRHC